MGACGWPVRPWQAAPCPAEQCLSSFRPSPASSTESEGLTRARGHEDNWFQHRLPASLPPQVFIIPSCLRSFYADFQTSCLWSTGPPLLALSLGRNDGPRSPCLSRSFVKPMLHHLQAPGSGSSMRGFLFGPCPTQGIIQKLMLPPKSLPTCILDKQGQHKYRLDSMANHWCAWSDFQTRLQALITSPDLVNA